MVRDKWNNLGEGDGDDDDDDGGDDNDVGGDDVDYDGDLPPNILIFAMQTEVSGKR